MKVAVVDMDDTLAIPRKLSHYLWTVSRWLFMLGRQLQKRNDLLYQKLGAYDKIIILTGRTIKAQKTTLMQLRKFGVKPSRIIFCPMNQVVRDWKQKVLQSLGENADWFDDLQYKELEY